MCQGLVFLRAAWFACAARFKAQWPREVFGSRDGVWTNKVKLLKYSGDDLTWGTVMQCDRGTFAFVPASALRLQIFWATLANHFPSDSVLHLKNGDYGTDSYHKTFSDPRMEDCKTWDLVYFYCGKSHQIQ